MQASETAVVADTLTEDLGVFVQRLLRPTHQELFAAFERARLSITQVKCLQALSDAHAPMSLGALSEELGMSLPAISRAIDGLVRRGQVKRAEDPRDRRSKLLTVSARGRKTYAELLEVRMAGIRRFVEDLQPDEREALGAALSPVIARFTS